MRGKDPDTGEFLAPSRSGKRRAALEVFELGETLVALSAAQLAKLPIPDDLLPHIRDTQRIPSHIARKRQLAFLAKQMRREDDARRAGVEEELDGRQRGANASVVSDDAVLQRHVEINANEHAATCDGQVANRALLHSPCAAILRNRSTHRLE